MPRRTRPKTDRSASPSVPLTRREEAASAPRIGGGELRGRRLEFIPDARTRPMKDRVRESLFDLLGTDVKGALAIDLFAGSGAIGFEAVSRGALRAIFVERHFPTAAILRRSGESLGIQEKIDVRTGDVLLWAKCMPQLPTSSPWIVFISPPWSFFSERWDDLASLIEAMRLAAPVGSTLVVEADTTFDPEVLPNREAWEIRPIPPAVLYFHREPHRESSAKPAVGDEA